MKFSIITPCTLTPYKNCASNLEAKLIRAVESVLKQKFSDWELIIVADGCKRTKEVIMPYFVEYMPKIRLIEIPKQKIWSGTVRNAGIYKATGEIITYLDIDDMLGENHLQIINDNFGDSDWVFFNDLIWKNGEFVENHCNMNVKGQCGTSNFAHKRYLDVYWNDDSYLHDYMIIKNLQARSSNYKVIPCSEYHICHRPNNPKFDV
jgi:glycosyltransferase involved in cell wall biosynthesis